MATIFGSSILDETFGSRSQWLLRWIDSEIAPEYRPRAISVGVGVCFSQSLSGESSFNADFPDNSNGCRIALVLHRLTPSDRHQVLKSYLIPSAI